MTLLRIDGKDATLWQTQRSDGTPVQFTLRAGSFNYTVAKKSDFVLTCDRMGRPWTIWRPHPAEDAPPNRSGRVEGAMFRRSYAGTLRQVQRDDAGVRQHIPISSAEWEIVWSEIRRQLAEDLSLLQDADDIEGIEPLKACLQRAVQMDEAALQRDAAQYQEIYGALGILPPDAYMNIVLQLAQGCPYNRCSFCTFYRHRKYRVRGLDEFLQHTSAVLDYLGESVGMRRGIFLADADVMAVEDEALLAVLHALQVQLPEHPIAAFVSSFARRHRTVEMYREFYNAGLRRLTLGMESGHDDVLKLLQKPVTAQQSLEVMQRIKAAGIQLNIVLLLGAGGTELANQHREDSVALIAKLPLDSEDRVFLSPLFLEPESPYFVELSKRGLTPLEPQDMPAQYDAFKMQLRNATQARIARYDIREFLP